MSTRRERAIRSFCEASGCEPQSIGWAWATEAIDAYEAELAADLQSDETVERAAQAMEHQITRQPLGHWTAADAMRAALRVVLDPEAAK
jgi:hypothetical protein